MPPESPPDLRFFFTLPGVPRLLISRGAGLLARMPIPKPLRPRLWKWLCSKLGVDAGLVPGEWQDYVTFLSLFTRALPPDSRPLPTTPGWLSPADGHLVAIADAAPEGSWVIKGTPYSTAELLPGASPQEIGHYRAYQIYLAPSDYHRFHTPCALKILKAVVEPGDLQPVDPSLLKRSMRVLQTNRRILLHCESLDGIPFAMLFVGALNVGGMRFVFDTTLGVPPLIRGERHYDPPPQLTAGEELGRFEFGSTVVLFAPPTMACVIPLDGPTRARETLLRFGPLEVAEEKEEVLEW